MKIAIPVKDESLIFFGNAGHAPKFAIYEMKGAGMFKSFDLEGLRVNPKMEGEDHDHDDEEHECSHDHDDEEHIKAHFTMSKALSDCDYIVLKRGCKNTINAFKEESISVKKYDGELLNAKEIVSFMSHEFK